MGRCIILKEGRGGERGKGMKRVKEGEGEKVMGERRGKEEGCEGEMKRGGEDEG